MAAKVTPPLLADRPLTYGEAIRLVLLLDVLLAFLRTADFWGEGTVLARLVHQLLALRNDARRAADAARATGNI